MSETRSRLLSVLLLPLVALVLFSTCLLAGVVNSIPPRAEEVFGPPDPDLSLSRRYLHSLILIWQSDKLTTPTDLEGGILEFHVQPGESPDEVIRGLTTAGLIDHPRLFRTYLIYRGFDKQIQAGRYPLSPAMSEVEIALALQDPSPQKTTLVIIPGWRSEEIAAALPDLGLEIQPDEFIAAVKQRNMEGFLFPGTYQVERDISPNLLLDILRESFATHVTPGIRDGITSQGLTLREGITLASIVEKEAVLEEEMPLIASVFLNRLEEDIPLGADPTVQYALGFNQGQQTWWTNPLTSADFEIDSPYNTYQIVGLPPGPISNPGLPAIRAVAFPAESSYYYFSAACDGSGRHQFAETFAEHRANICP